MDFAAIKNIRPVYCILLVMLCIAMLIDLGSSGTWLYPVTTIIIFLMCSLLFLNYKWWPAAIVALGIYFIHNALRFPRLANHANLEMMIIPVVFLLLLLKVTKQKPKWLNGNIISLIFRYSLITIYFIAGFNKLNSGFFMVDGSCVKLVNLFFNPLLFKEPLINSSVLIHCMQITALFVEMLIPFGILFAKTRKVTVWILVIFHFYLSLCNFSNFSAFAGFLLAGSILDFSINNIPAKFISALKAYVFFALLSVLIIFCLIHFKITSSLYYFTNGFIFNIGWIIFFTVFIGSGIIDKRIIDQPKRNIIPFFPVIILLLWGAQPYVGLSNAGNLTMFSNLITEKSRSNHYLINTNKTKIWNFEEDFVSVLALSDNIEEKLHLVNYDIPLTEFKLKMFFYVRNKGTKANCTLQYRGKKIYIDDLGNSDFSKIKWWYKYIQFRKIPQKGTNECMW